MRRATSDEDLHDTAPEAPPLDVRFISPAHNPALSTVSASSRFPSVCGRQLGLRVAYMLEHMVESRSMEDT